MLLLLLSSSLLLSLSPQQERLLDAKKLCQSKTGRLTLIQHPVDRLARANTDDELLTTPTQEQPAELYQHFLTALFSHIDGTMDSSNYEDECRQLMGTASYLLFTMEKLVHNTAKTLAQLVTDATAAKTRELYSYQLARRKLEEATTPLAGRPAQLLALSRSYRSNVAAMMMARSEDCFRVHYKPSADNTSATLTLTFVQLLAEDTAAGTLAPYPAVTGYVSALTGQAPPADGTADADGVEEAAEVAAAKAAASRPFLARNAAAGAAAGAPAVVVSQAPVQVATTGRFVHGAGTSETLVRAGGLPAPAGVAPVAAANGAQAAPAPAAAPDNDVPMDA